MQKLNERQLSRLYSHIHYKLICVCGHKVFVFAIAK